MDNLNLSYKELIKNTKSNLTLMANTSAFIMTNYAHLNWVGFYLYDGHETLLLGPLQGKVACEEIKVGSGVCGMAFFDNKIINVPNVNKFNGHIVCDSNSKSELVFPLIKDGVKIGVLDIDSYLFNRFDEDIIKELTSLVNAFLNYYQV